MGKIDKLKFITIIYPIVAVIMVIFISILTVNASSDSDNQEVVEENIYSLGDIVKYDTETGIYYSNDLVDVMDKEILVCGFLIKEDNKDNQYKLLNVPYLTTYQGLGEYGVIAVNIQGNIKYDNQDVILAKCVLRKDKNNEMYLYCLEQDEYSLIKSTKMDEYKEFMLGGYFNDLVKQIQNIQDIPNIPENERIENIKSVKKLREKLGNNFYNNNENIIDTIDKLALINANPKLISGLDKNELFTYRSKLVSIVMKDVLAWGII